MSFSHLTERRRFTRVNFDAEATVVQAGETYDAQLLDLSIKGVLTTVEAHTAIRDGPVTVHIKLASGPEIQMEASLIHRKQQELGFRCDSIDLDSAAHLRRLMELNLNCADAAERVLEEMLTPTQPNQCGMKTRPLDPEIMNKSTDNRRRTLRVQLRTHGNLTVGEHSRETELLNLSQGGALVAILEPHELRTGEAISLEIMLPGGNQVRMEGTIAHVNEHMVGLDCTPVTDADAAQIKTVIEQLANE